MAKKVFREGFNFNNPLCRNIEREEDKFFYVDPTSKTRREIGFFKSAKMNGLIICKYIDNPEKHEDVVDLESEKSLILNQVDYDTLLGRKTTVVKQGLATGKKPAEKNVTAPQAEVVPQAQPQTKKKVKKAPAEERNVQERPKTEAELQAEAERKAAFVKKMADAKRAAAERRGEIPPQQPVQQQEVKPQQPVQQVVQPVQQPVRPQVQPQPVQQAQPVQQPVRPQVQQPVQQTTRVVKYRNDIPLDGSNRYIYNYDRNLSKGLGNVEVFTFNSASKAGLSTAPGNNVFNRVYEIWDDGQKKYLLGDARISNYIRNGGLIPEFSKVISEISENNKKGISNKHLPQVYLKLVDDKADPFLTEKELRGIVGGRLQDDPINITLKDGTKLRTVYYPYDEVKKTCDGWALAESVNAHGKRVYFYTEIDKNSPINPDASPEVLGAGYEWKEVDKMFKRTVRHGLGKVFRIGGKPEEILTIRLRPAGNEKAQLVHKGLRPAKGSENDIRAKKQLDAILAESKGTIKRRDAGGKTQAGTLVTLCTVVGTLVLSFFIGTFGSLGKGGSDKAIEQDAKDYLQNEGTRIEKLNTDENLTFNWDDPNGVTFGDYIFKTNITSQNENAPEINEDQVSNINTVDRQQIAQEALQKLGTTLVSKNAIGTLSTAVNAKEISFFNSYFTAMDGTSSSKLFDFDQYGKKFYGEIGHALGQQAACFAYADGYSEATDDVISFYTAYINTKDGKSINNMKELEKAIGKSSAEAYFLSYAEAFQSQMETFAMQSPTVDPGKDDPSIEDPTNPAPVYDDVDIKDFYDTDLNAAFTTVLNTRNVTGAYKEIFSNINADINYIKLEDGILSVGFTDVEDKSSLYEVSYDVSLYNLDAENLQAEDLINAIGGSYLNIKDYTNALSLADDSNYLSGIDSIISSLSLTTNATFSNENIYFSFKKSDVNGKNVYTMGVLAVSDDGVPYTIDNYGLVRGDSLKLSSAIDYSVKRIAGNKRYLVEGLSSYEGYSFNAENVKESSVIKEVKVLQVDDEIVDEVTGEVGDEVVNEDETIKDVEVGLTK